MDPFAKFVQTVLADKRSSEQRDDLVAKLSGEGVKEPCDLAGTSREALEMRLASHGSFTLADVTDCVRLHDAHSSVSSTAIARPRERSRSERRRSCSQPRRSRSRGTSYRFRGRRARRQHQTKETKPALWEAVENGDVRTVTHLLSAGHDPGEKFQGWTPLMKAAEEDYVEIVGILLNTKAADIEATNNKGRTALSFAAAPSKRGYERRDSAVQALRVLLAHQASCDHRDDSGRTARERALEERRQDAVDIIDSYNSTRALGFAAVAS